MDKKLFQSNIGKKVDKTKTIFVNLQIYKMQNKEKGLY